MSSTATRESGQDRSFTRREVLRLAAGVSGVCALGGGAGACARVARCRDVAPNPFVDAGRPLLVVVRGEDPGAMLRAGLERIGGLERLRAAGREVLLKGNFCARQRYPVTTAGDTIVAVAQELKRAGFVRTTLFESQGTRLVPSTSADEAVRQLGVFDQVTRHGVEVRMCDALEAEEFRPVRNRAWSIQRPVMVHRALHDAPVVLSLPIPKRHQLARFSCALKMHFGSVSQADRYLAHKDARAGQRGFDERLVHFADAVRPQLNVVDARALLTRGGPTLSAGGEVVRGVNRLILCGDVVATDAYCARLLAEHDRTFSPEMIAGQLEYAAALGLGTADLDAVRIVEVCT